MLCETLAHAARGTHLRGPIITSGQRRPRTGQYNYTNLLISKNINYFKKSTKLASELEISIEIKYT